LKQQPELQSDRSTFNRWMELADKVAAEHEEALRELAKR
jgi:hypothetical protein